MSPGQNLHPPLAHGHVFRGAKALDPEVHDHENFDRPAVLLNPERVRRHVVEDIAKLVKRRIPFRMHVSYNENITPFLDAMEEMNRTVPLDGLKWSIEHAKTITPENIARVKALGAALRWTPKWPCTATALSRPTAVRRHSKCRACASSSTAASLWH
jgi:hypothetical protein